MRSTSLAPLAIAVVLAGCNGRAIDVGSNDSGEPAHDAAARGTGPARTTNGEAGPAAGLDADGDPCVSVEADSIAIRQRSCIPCHQAPLRLSGFDFVLDDAKLATSSANVAMDDAGMHRRMVIPGDPEDSFVYERVVLGQMPPPSSIAANVLGPAAAAQVVRPNASDESILYEWILSCMGVNGRAQRASDASYGGTGDDGSVVGVGQPGDAGNPGDASQIPDAGPIAVDATAPPPGLAGFAFVVNGVVRTPLTCPSDNWEYNPLDANGQPLCDQNGLCPTNPEGGAGTTAVLLNTGQVPIAYTARPLWNVPYPPGVPTGEPNVLVGVLDPQGHVDITSVFVGGITAILGSAEPFSNPDAGKYVGDEGTIPWPAGVAGSGGATQMHVAQIDVQPSCKPVSLQW